MEHPVASFREVVAAVFEYGLLCKENGVKFCEIENDKKQEMFDKYSGWSNAAFPEEAVWTNTTSW
jgi:hypothetical protein